MPPSLKIYELLKRLPGYTAQSLMEEDGYLVDEFFEYMSIENAARAAAAKGG